MSWWEYIIQWLIKFFRHKKAKRVFFIIGKPQPKTGGSMAQAKAALSATSVAISTVEKVAVTAVFADNDGNPAPVDGIPVWTVSDPAVATVTPDATGMSVEIISVAPGEADVTVEGDADLGAGVTHVDGTLHVTVTVAQASQVIFSVGTPEPK